MPEELKPCPFCGGKAHIFENDYGECNFEIYYTIGCKTDDCFLYMGADNFYDTKELAIEAWNKRA